MTKTILTTMAVGAVLVFGVLGPATAGDWGDRVSARAKLLNDPQVPAGSVMAGQWDVPVSGMTSVTGQRQAADHATDWAKAAGAKQNVRGAPQTADNGPYGFLAQALGGGGPASHKEVAAK